MSEMVVCDARERAVIECLRRKGPGQPAPVEVRELASGDFIAGGMLVERKTLPDLVASLSDGRFREQRERLVESARASGLVPVYLLESGPAPPAQAQAQARVRGALLSLARRGIAVLPTSGVEDTCRFLESMAAAPPPPAARGTCMPPLAGEVKLSRRRDRASPASTYVCQLCQIPGVSRGFAERIRAVVPGIRELAADVGAGGALLASVLGRGRRLATALEHLGGGGEISCSGGEAEEQQQPPPPSSCPSLGETSRAPTTSGA